MNTTKSLKELIAYASAIFGNEKFKSVKVVYATEDGNVFVEENRAILHVKDTDLKYHPITRLDTSEKQESNSEDRTEINEATVAEKTKELEELELVTANYQKMRTLALFFQIETPDMKSETLIAALTEYKNKISA